MDLAKLGIPTHHTRVESWECDFNNHWNARFYTRAIQHACERVSSVEGAGNPGGLAVSTRALRFHRELFASAAVEVRSIRLADSPLAGWTVHLLVSGNAVSACAVEKPACAVMALPQVRAAEIKRVLPRAFAAPEVTWDEAAPGSIVTEAGPVRPSDLDHRGCVLAEQIVQRTNAGIHHQLDRVGFTPEYTSETGISRMAVEQIITPGGPCPAGALLRARSRLSGFGEKSFWSTDWLETLEGELIATVHRQVVTVDLKRRAAVRLPEILLSLRG